MKIDLDFRKKKIRAPDIKYNLKVPDMRGYPMLPVSQQPGFTQSRPRSNRPILAWNSDRIPVLPHYAPPASKEKQLIWLHMPENKKMVLRKFMRDSDRNGVPDEFDCQPYNPFKDADEDLDEYEKSEYEKEKEILRTHHKPKDSEEQIEERVEAFLKSQGHPTPMGQLRWMDKNGNFRSDFRVKNEEKTPKKNEEIEEPHQGGKEEEVLGMEEEPSYYDNPASRLSEHVRKERTPSKYAPGKDTLYPVRRETPAYPERIPFAGVKTVYTQTAVPEPPLVNFFVTYGERRPRGLEREIKRYSKDYVERLVDINKLAEKRAENEKIQNEILQEPRIPATQRRSIERDISIEGQMLPLSYSYPVENRKIRPYSNPSSPYRKVWEDFDKENQEDIRKAEDLRQEKLRKVEERRQDDLKKVEHLRHRRGYRQEKY